MSAAKPRHAPQLGHCGEACPRLAVAVLDEAGESLGAGGAGQRFLGRAMADHVLRRLCSTALSRRGRGGRGSRSARTGAADRLAPGRGAGASHGRRPRGLRRRRRGPRRWAERSAGRAGGPAAGRPARARRRPAGTARPRGPTGAASEASAELVWMVEITRWPVSAACTAMCAVSRSLISPIMITSGSWRRNERSAAAKLSPMSLRACICTTPAARTPSGSSTVTIFLTPLLRWISSR